MRVLADLMISSRRRGWPLLALLLCLCCGLAQAQSATDDGGAPPDRVARLSYIAGDLGLLPAGAQDWTSADLNRPLTTGDRLSTGPDARAELELGGGVLRMDGSTDFGMLNLNDQLAQVELTQGTLNISVRQINQGQSYEIDTPTLALVVSHPGTFRVDVDNGGTGTRVTVFSGQATVYGENNAQHDVFEGNSYQFDDASLAALRVSDIGGGDAFDAWCSQRDQRYAQAQATRYVSSDMVGYQDLDQYGNWQSSPEYGAVWYPDQMPAGWAPYRDGHWAFIAPWGWTWIDDAPWGFAPYHYGRWAFIGGAWGWVPGPIAVRPVYAPALVAFVGGGGGWGISVGIGIGAPVGWFPLGPGEIYNPWYHCDRAYYRRVNVTNIYVHNTYNRTTIINNINNQYNDYRNGRLPANLHYANRVNSRGFTAVPDSAFANGQRVQRNLVKVNAQRFAAAPVLAHGMSNVRPDLRSIAPPRNPRARPLPVADFRRNVIARTPPPATLPTARAPFGEQVDRAVRAPAAATPRPFDNVRVLGNRTAPRAITNAGEEASHGMPATPRAGFGGNRNPTARGEPPQSPTAESVTPDTRQVRPQPAPLPAGALPSSRFARPEQAPRDLPNVEPIRRAPAGDMRRQMPRPGVSYISGPEQAHPAPEQNHDTLPQPPRFEHESAQPAPAQPAYRQRYQPPQNTAPAAEAMRPEPAQPRFEQQPPRFEQQQPRVEQQQPRFEQQQPRVEQAQPRFQQAPRFDNAPAPQQRYQPPREFNNAPAWQPPREEGRPAYPMPRQEAPQQRRAEPAPRHEPPPRKDDEQH